MTSMIGEFTDDRLERAEKVLDEAGIPGDAHARSIVRQVDAFDRWPDHYVLNVAHDMVAVARKWGEAGDAVDRH